MTPPTYRAPRVALTAPGGYDLHQHDMTATFSVDLTLAEAQARLAEIGQWLPVDGDPGTRLGDLVDSDSTGPLRLGYGAWRDLLLGLQFRKGSGELITAGGRTVKNVAGYDLTKFMVGQSGVFGTLLTITTRTYRRPQGAILVRCRADPGLLRRLMPTALRPQWAAFFRGELLLGYVADERTLSHYADQMKQIDPLQVTRQAIEQDIADRARLWQARGPIVYRASVPPMRVLEFAAAGAAREWIADAAFGVVVGALTSADEIPAIREAASRVGGSVKFRRDTLMGPLLELSTNPIERQIIERLKRAFDPENKLVPLPWQ